MKSNPADNFKLNINNKIENIENIECLIKHLKSDDEIINKLIEKVIFCMLHYLLEKYYDDDFNINNYYTNTLLLFNKVNIVIDTKTLKILCDFIEKKYNSIYKIKINTNLFDSENSTNYYYKFIEYENKNKINSNYKHNNNILLIRNCLSIINVKKLNKYRLYLSLFIKTCKSKNKSIFKDKFCYLEKIYPDENFLRNLNYFPVNDDIDNFLSELDPNEKHYYPFMELANNLRNFIKINNSKHNLDIYLFLAYKIDCGCDDIIFIINEYSIDGLKKHPVTIQTLGNKYICENYDLEYVKIDIKSN